MSSKPVWALGDTLSKQKIHFIQKHLGSQQCLGQVTAKEKLTPAATVTTTVTRNPRRLKMPGHKISRGHQTFSKYFQLIFVQFVVVVVYVEGGSARP